jgi:class 3 adenylate cyclase
MEGMMVGTVAYMPPEQALGRQPDARSDLYSMGCILYEMATGRPPFLGDDAVAIISQHINTAPVAPSWHNPEVPRALEALIMRLLAKAPEDRPESAAAIPEVLTAILQSTSAVAAQAVQEAANPLDRLAGGVFVGREKEMDELRAGLEDSLSGRGRLLMLVGEPGIGKTRTSEEFATYARLRNVQVLWGRCYEGEGAPAYWPWVQLIRSYVHDREPKELMSQMGPGAADIAQVVSEVRERLPGLPAPPTLEPEQARFRLFDSITTFLKNASGVQPLVLVLDDLHWADKPSLLLLQFLAKELRGSRLLVLGTYRDVELRRQHPLAQTLGELNRENLSQRVLLRGLTENDLRRFVEVTAGTSPPDALVKAVYKETEGNPFFVNEIVRLLVADGRLEHAESVKEWSVTIPQSVREVVGRRLDHLSEECNKVLTTGSVIGREFARRLLEKVSEVKGDRLLEALEEAMGARVIAELPRTPDQYWFSHALIRETLYEELSTTRRVRLHRQIGEALEELDAEGNLPQLAYHFCEAAPGGDVDKAIHYAGRAAERSLSLLAYEEAAGHYERALQALEQRRQPDDRERCELLLALGAALRDSGDRKAARPPFEAVAEMARKLQAPELLASAALGLGSLFTVGIVDQPAVALLEEARRALGERDSAIKVRVLGALVGSQPFGAPSETRLALSREAVDMARRVGNDGALASALLARDSVLWGELEALEERLEIVGEGLRLAEAAGDKGTATTLSSFRCGALLEIGDIPALDAEIENNRRLAEELRQPAALSLAVLKRATRALLDGRLEEGERLAQEAVAAGRNSPNALQMFGVQLYFLRREQGRVRELEAGQKANVQRFPLLPAYRAGLANTYAEMGREAEAREEFELLAADDFAHVLPRDPNFSIGATLLAEVCYFLGDTVRAAVLYDVLLPHARRWVTAGSAAVTTGCISRFLGLLATTMERWPEAEQHFQYALEVHMKMGARLWVPWTQFQYAEMLLRRNDAGDRKKALSLLAQALATAQELGLKALLERALALKLKAQGLSSTDVKTSIDAVASAVYVEKPDLGRHAAPDGTVTIMFSDIEGSTAMTERLGDKLWMEVLKEHNTIVREQVKAHGGFEVKSEGDGFMVAFQSARRALQCAIAIQQAFDERNQDATESVKVRIGLHTGETVKEGEDFFGKNVILAARIAAQAKGGEVLASSLLKELTESGGDIRFGEGREVELKGLSGAHRVFPVKVEG